MCFSILFTLGRIILSGGRHGRAWHAKKGNIRWDGQKTMAAWRFSHVGGHTEEEHNYNEVSPPYFFPLLSIFI